MTNIYTDNLSELDLFKSRGSIAVFKDDSEKIDCFTHYASLPLGYNPHCLTATDFIDQVKWASVQKLANPDVDSEYYKTFREEFKSITQDFKYHFFIDGGALAVENALKVAMDWKLQREKIVGEVVILGLGNAFHGRSGYTLSLTNTDPNKTACFSQFFDWPRLYTHGYGQQYPLENLDDQLNYLLNEYNVAAMVVEPIQCEGGDIHFPKELFNLFRHYCDEYNVLLIFDEVQTGWSTGNWWGFQTVCESVKPDIIAFSKKCQVGGIAVSSRIDDVQDHVFRRRGRISSTWGSNLTDMVRSTWLIREIKKNGWLEHSRMVGEKFLKVLESLADKGIMNPRAKGVLIAFDLETREKRDSVFSKLNEKVWCIKTAEKSIRFRPSLNFPLVFVDEVINHLERAL